MKMPKDHEHYEAVMHRIEMAKKTGHLNLSRLYLGFVPEEAVSLSRITRLYLGFNELTFLPTNLNQLHSLTRLYLNCNNFIKLPESLGQLSAVEYLDISENNLEILPDAIGVLSNLTHLDVKDNKLIALPECLGQLSNLVQLNIENNVLTMLPESVVNLQNLEKLYASGNVWKMPPPQVIGKRGIANIARLRDWYAQLADQGVEHLFEAKLLILGEGGSGKTTLAKKLENPNATLPMADETTEGIDLRSWTFPYPDADNGLIVNIWDFGGQDIYKFPHQFFLTQESLYAIVTDTRADDTDFNYWLQTVELYGGEDSPILVVGNEISGRPLRRDLSAYEAHFDIKEVLSADLSDPSKAREVRERIQKWFAHLPYIGSEVPARWVDVRKVLLNIAEETPYISLGTFYDICETHNIARGQSALNLSHTLHHRIGVILHYQEDPVLRNTIFLQPDWATRAVYRLIEHDCVTNDGRFTKADIYTIWDSDEYNGKELDLLALLEKFELCYQIPEIDTFIVPTWLPTDRPKGYVWIPNNDLQLQYHYPAFIPLGLLLRLMVNLQKYIERHEDEMAWRRGMVLHYRKDTRAEIIQTLDNHRITVRVQGSEAGKLRSIIVHTLDVLHRRFEKLILRREIPCSCDHCVGAEQPHFYAEDELENLLEKGVFQRQCAKSGAVVEIYGLLDGFINEFASGLVDVWETDWKHLPDGSPLKEDQLDELNYTLANKRQRVFNAHEKAKKRSADSAIFISYAWGGESEDMANQVDTALRAAGLKVTRDKRDLGYKGRIQNFMRQLGRGSAVVVILSDKYLHSENCMFELTEIAKNGKFYDRIFPITMSDANFYKVTERMKLVKHWQDQLDEIDATAKELNMGDLKDFMPEYEIYQEIKANFGKLTTFLKDLNTLTPQIHIDEGFETLIEEIKKVLR